MKIAVLTHPSPAATYFARRLAREHELAAVYCEHSTAAKMTKAKKQFRRNRHRQGLAYALARFAELPFVVWLDASYRHTEEKFFADKQPNPPTDWPWHEVPDINAPAVVEAVRALSPEALCVFGSSILRRPLIEIPRLGVLNMHTGLLPQYRGAKSEFWALANSDFANVGVTVHLIDEGVDTGQILQQTTLAVEPTDNDRTLRCRNIVAGTELMLAALAHLAAGTAQPRGQDIAKKKTYSTPTWPAYRQMKRNLRRRSG